MAKQIEELQIGYSPEDNNLYLGKINKDGTLHKTVRRVFTKEIILGMAEWFAHNLNKTRMMGVPIKDDQGNDGQLRIYATVDKDKQDQIEAILGITNEVDI